MACVCHIIRTRATSTMFRAASSSAMRHLHTKRLTPAAGAALSIPGTTMKSSISGFRGVATSSASCPRAFVEPAHVRGDVTVVAIAVAAVLGAAGVGKIWWDASSSQTGVTKDNLASYFNELADIVDELVVSVAFPLGETVEVPEDLTADRTLEIMTLVLDGVSRAMEEALAEAKQAGMKNVNLEGHLWQEK
ncbi:hypothetical protein DYB30_000367 [Aphanomyces astaci]|uniref:Uncharacterized protein n=1 Tax=Aphanomyces astaci TaxID=112090 RepID=A0A397CVA1_APHAT|nr:hypothetical protein DYB34_002950 [Aphanomyces astaci]RHY53651.1 hypothetical protein DYB38_000090 [Aphanomyces astaci]RHY76304.1 hypothetical protein DYB30_000367 [Aphanomyces astaci]